MKYIFANLKAVKIEVFSPVTQHIISLELHSKQTGIAVSAIAFSSVPVNPDFTYISLDSLCFHLATAAPCVLLARARMELIRGSICRPCRPVRVGARAGKATHSFTLE